MKSSPMPSQARRLMYVTVLINILLALTKVAGGWLCHSRALLADGVHSFSDLFTDALVYAAVYWGHQHADDNHPYGHERIETLATTFLACILGVVGTAIIYDGVMAWHESVSSSISSAALWLVVMSIALKEGLYHYTRQVAQQIDSKALMANAWHHRSDAGSSMAVLFGLLASQWGMGFADCMAAIVVGLFIVWIAVGLLWSALKELVDTAVDAPLEEKIKQCIVDTPGVVAVHQLRTRTMGRKIMIDVHILVDAYLTVSEGHHIAHQARHRLRQNFKHVDVTVHVDPEDDEICAPCETLPSRALLLPDLQKAWHGLPGVEGRDVRLHYLDGQIEIDVWLVESTVSTYSVAELTELYQKAMAHMLFIRRARVVISLAASNQ